MNRINLLLIAPDKTKQWNRFNSDWFKYLYQFCDYSLYDVNYDLHKPEEYIRFFAQPQRHIKEILDLYANDFDAILIHGFRYSLRSIDFNSLYDINIPIFGFVQDAWNKDFDIAMSQYTRWNIMFTRCDWPMDKYKSLRHINIPHGMAGHGGQQLKKIKKWDVCFMGKRNARIYPLREKIPKIIKSIPSLYYCDALIPYNDYIEVLDSSKISICTSSIYKVVLNKVFESIYACSLLFYNNTVAMERLGFDNGKHYVQYDDDLSDLEDKIKYYLDHDKEREEIVYNAYQLCAREHLIKDRVRYIGECMNETLNR